MGGWNEFVPARCPVDVGCTAAYPGVRLSMGLSVAFVGEGRLAFGCDRSGWTGMGYAGDAAVSGASGVHDEVCVFLGRHVRTSGMSVACPVYGVPALGDLSSGVGHELVGGLSDGSAPGRR